jgi:Na+-translocating ferredoxin:NAD+ oxidoreductase RnfD subunit
MTDGSLLTPVRSAGRSVHVRGREYPIVLPSIRDARLHTAAVVMTIHALGQVTLGFAVSVPQILLAILATAVIEVAVTAVRNHRLQWPASAMLTGSGVGLILRVGGTQPGDHWSFHGWYLFAGVAAASLATKYLVRWRGSHLLNPSNVGLVAAFLLLGRQRVEPLDLWWAPMGIGMVVAYAAIVGGGIAITARLRLFELALAFWITLVAGLAILAWSGHCITTPWSNLPVCDARFLWLFATSPEILIFLFFMITDPKTVPIGRRQRVAFGISVGALATLLIAPQTTEFSAKVALLSALTVACLLRPLVARLAPAWSATLAAFDRLSARAVGGSPQTTSDRRGVALGLALPMALGLFALGVTELGHDARRATVAPVDAVALPDPSSIVAWKPPAELPALSFDPAIAVFGEEFVDGAHQRDMAVALMRDLEVEAELLVRRDRELLRAVDHGARLEEMQSSIDDAEGGAIVVRHYTFESLRFVVVRRGRQSGALIGAEAQGTVREQTHAPDGRLVSDSQTSVSSVFSLRRASDDRWLIVDAR